MRRLAVLAVFLGLVLEAGAASALTFSTADEARMYRMVNSKRAERGVSALKLLDGLTKVARDQSAQMVQQHKLFHNPDLAADISAAGISASWRGENVVVAADVDLAYSAFVNSGSHLENMLRSNYNAIGVGVAIAPSGAVYVTLVFAEVRGVSAPIPPPTVAPATPPPPPPPPPATPPAPKSTPKPTPPPVRVVPIAIEGGIVVPQLPFTSE